MGTLREKNKQLEVIINDISKKIESFEGLVVKGIIDKTYFVSLVDTIIEGILEINEISQENKSIYYRFVPLDKDLFNEPGKSKFKDQYHKIDNFLHASRFEAKALKEELWDVAIEKKNILISCASLKENIQAIESLSKKISDVADQFVNQDKDLLKIVSEMKQGNKAFKVLVVDDVAGVLFASKRFLDGKGFTTFEADKVDQAIKCIKENSPDIIILDLNIESNLDGLKVLNFIRENSLPVKCIISTVVDDEKQLAVVSASKPDKILVKPFDNNQLLTQINAVIGISKT